MRHARSLLDAIRKAGGAGKAKLRSAKEKRIESKKKIQEEKTKGVPPASGGDLMSDLAAKLTMRRKGISGTKQPGAANANDGQAQPGNAMDRISAMIPPPPSASGGNEGGGGDEDWD